MNEEKLTDNRLTDNKLNFIPEKLAANTQFKRAYRDLKNGKYEDQPKSGLKQAALLVLQEKEVLFFALLQWVAIALAYYIWVQVIRWIPMEVWEDEKQLGRLLLNLVLMGWSLLCIGLAALPIGIFTGAVGAAQLLRATGRPSTVAACLKLSWGAAWQLWVFHWLDGWITVERILRRLPKKRGWGADLIWLSITAPLYFAWKTAGMALTPGLLAGKGLMEGGESAIDYVVNNLKEAIVLRSQYSILCWVVGIAGYIGGIISLVAIDPFDAAHAMFAFYVWAGIPILAGAGLVVLIIRPIFIIAACNNYAIFQHAKGEKLSLPKSPSKGISIIITFLLFCLICGTIVFYRHELGISAILSGK